MRDQMMIFAVNQICGISYQMDFDKFCREILGEEPRYFSGGPDRWQFNKFVDIREAAKSLSRFDKHLLSSIANATLS